MTGTSAPRESDDPRPVAAFDLDGTLTRGDTLLPFLLRVCGTARTLRAAAACAPQLLAAKLIGGTSRDAAKTAVLGRLLAGEDLARLTREAEVYADLVVTRDVRDDVLDHFERHRAEGHVVAIVSASPELYVAAIGRRLGADAVLATRLEATPDGRLTGRLLGANCRGPEKVVRLAEWLGTEPGGRPALAFAYGDSAGDREMLAIAGSATKVRRPGKRSLSGKRPRSAN